MPENMPEQDELVLSTVKKIMPYGAFCTLDEYSNREAFVHISEVAPRMLSWNCRRNWAMRLLLLR